MPRAQLYPPFEERDDIRRLFGPNPAGANQRFCPDEFPAVATVFVERLVDVIRQAGFRPQLGGEVDHLYSHFSDMAVASTLHAARHVNIVADLPHLNISQVGRFIHQGPAHTTDRRLGKCPTNQLGSNESVNLID